MSCNRLNLLFNSFSNASFCFFSLQTVRYSEISNLTNSQSAPLSTKMQWMDFVLSIIPLMLLTYILSCRRLELNFQKHLPFFWSLPDLSVSLRTLWSDSTPGSMFTFSIKFSKWSEQKSNQVGIVCVPDAKWKISCPDWQFATHPLGCLPLNTRLYLLGSSGFHDALAYYLVYRAWDPYKDWSHRPKFVCSFFI